MNRYSIQGIDGEFYVWRDGVEIVATFKTYERAQAYVRRRAYATA